MVEIEEMKSLFWLYITDGYHIEKLHVKCNNTISCSDSDLNANFNLRYGQMRANTKCPSTIVVGA